jgi:hypothetical protein
MDKNEKVEEEARGEEAVKAQKKELDFFPRVADQAFFRQSRFDWLRRLVSQHHREIY